MPHNLSLALKEFESFVRSGRASTFYVHIQQDGLLLKSVDTEKKLRVQLDQELMHPLKAFFLGIDAIEFGSFDYTNLNGFLNSIPVKKENSASCKNRIELGGYNQFLS